MRNDRVVPYDHWLRSIDLGQPIEARLPDDDKIEGLLERHRKGQMRKV